MTKQDSLIIKGVGICAMLALHLFDYSFCKICVAVFVFISGVGMTCGYTKIGESGPITVKSAAIFLFKRIKKFYLNYWFVFLIFVGLGIFVFKRTPNDAYGARGVFRLILDFFCVGNYNYDVQWWFNTMILILYLLFPFLYYSVKKMPFLTLGISLSLTKFALWDNYAPLFSDYPFLFQVYQLNMMLFVFIVGIFLVIKWDWIVKIANTRLFVPACLVLLSFFVYSHYETRIPFFHGWRVEAFIIATFTVLVSAIPVELKNRIHLFEFLGKHSSNIYFFHWFIVNWWLKEFLESFGNPVLVFVISMLICVFISIVLNKLKICFKYDKLLQIA